MDRVPEPPSRLEVTISTRTLVRLLATAAIFLLLMYVLWQVRAVGELVLISAFLALALNPIVTVLARSRWYRSQPVPASEGAAASPPSSWWSACSCS